jgi:benzoyl-CoA reductase subunit C
MWMASNDNGLVLVSYGPSIVKARAGKGVNVTITEDTEYPFRGFVKLTVDPDKPSRFPIYLRRLVYVIDKIFTQFHEWIDNRHEYAKTWKEKTGNKIAGYLCTYVPEEILYAADILPVRILGSHEPPTVTEPYIFAMYCHFCRDCLAQGLEGKFSYLDGIVEGQSCIHLRQAFNGWRLHIPIDYTYYIHVPHGVQTPRATPYLTKELAKFKESLEKWTGRSITKEDLDRGIQTLNRNRELMKKVSEFRRMDPPKEFSKVK